MKKILLIEDNDDVRENIAEILELASYNVVSAENGKIGVEKAKAELPDMIICDVMMPELDGYGVLHMLSRNTPTSTIPFIFLTAKAEKSDIRKGMNLGADDYITKPFEEAELLDAIETRFKKSEIVKKEFANNLEGVNEFINFAKGIEELNNLTNDRKKREYNKKEILFREGDYANYLYFIIEGRIKLTKTDDYGKELVTDIFNKGDFIGYTPLIEGTEYFETATAMDDTEVAIIPKDDFLSLMQKNRDVANKFIKLLANNVQEKEERLLKLAYAPVRERVADSLVALYNKETNESIKISREDLASIVGTATESLIRTLSEFKNDKLIEINGREISITNYDKLKSLAGQ